MSQAHAGTPMDKDADNRSHVGTIVLSPSLHLLFIDEDARALLKAMGPDGTWTSSSFLPPTLLAFSRDIARVLISTKASRIIQRRQISASVGPSRLHVSAFGLPSSDGQDKRIVLILYRSHPLPWWEPAKAEHQHGTHSPSRDGSLASGSRHGRQDVEHPF